MSEATDEVTWTLEILCGGSRLRFDHFAALLCGVSGRLRGPMLPNLRISLLVEEELRYRCDIGLRSA